MEDRRAIGYDYNLVKEGPLVYLLTPERYGHGPLKVLPIDENDQTRRDAPLSLGASVTYGSVTVTCTASSTSGSTIAYQYQ